MMKSTFLLVIAFGVGIVASTRTITQGAGDNPVQNVFQFDELEQKRSGSDRSYHSFLDVDSLHCGIYSLDVDETDPQKPHAQDEIYYVQQGQAKIHINGKDFDLKPGSIVFVPAYAEHRFHSITKDLKTLVFFSKVAIEKPKIE